MARTSNNKQSEQILTENITSDVEKENTVTISKEQYNDIIEKTKKLEELIEKMSQMQAQTQYVQQPVYQGNKMDTPCTLIHLVQCGRDLPTTIVVNGVTHYFTSFGERKTFTWSDISNIVSKYRSWFTRGVFALGEDCEVFKDELPSDIMSLKLPESFYKKMSLISTDEFRKYFSPLTTSQKAQVANVWKIRYMNNEKGYNDLEKIKIINKETNGLLKGIVTEIYSQE